MKNLMKRKIMAMLLATTMIFQLATPAFAIETEKLIDTSMIMTLEEKPTGDFTVTGGALNTDYTYENNTLTIKSSTALAVTGTTTTDKIVVAAGVEANITLDGVSIVVSGTENACAFDIQGNAKVTLTLTGENTLKSGKWKAGISVPQSATLTITGGGKLDVTLSSNFSIKNNMILEIPINSTLTIPNGLTLTNEGVIIILSNATLINNGTLINNEYTQNTGKI